MQGGGDPAPQTNPKVSAVMLCMHMRARAPSPACVHNAGTPSPARAAWCSRCGRWLP